MSIDRRRYDLPRSTSGAAKYKAEAVVFSATRGSNGGGRIGPKLLSELTWSGAVGVNLIIPIFNGFLYSSEAKEAGYRSRADAERTRDLRDQIVRDVRTAWLPANTAYQRIGVTTQLLKQANEALQLAQTRYQLGLSSIVEFSRAQLQQTSAAIDNTNAL